MSLSTLRIALRPNILRSLRPLVVQRSRQGSTAVEEMRAFWAKNLKLKRPNSPWIIYHMHLPMVTSLTHRVTGVVMGVVLYSLAITLMVMPMDFPQLVEFIKSLNIPTPILFACKAIAAFPLVYHYFNGIRHLTWDAGHGFLLSTQYRSGTIIMTGSIMFAFFLASIAYLGKKEQSIPK